MPKASRRGWERHAPIFTDQSVSCSLRRENFLPGAFSFPVRRQHRSKRLHEIIRGLQGRRVCAILLVLSVPHGGYVLVALQISHRVIGRFNLQ